MLNGGRNEALGSFPADEDFLSEFTELSLNRAMIDQVIMTLGQRSTGMVLYAPDSFFRNDNFVESNRRMNLLIQLVALNATPDANEVDDSDDDDSHLPHLELTQILRDVSFVDVINDESGHVLSFLRNSSVEAEDTAAINHVGVTHSIRVAIDSLPEEKIIHHINVAMSCNADMTQKDLSIPAKFSLSLMKATRALHDSTGADDCTTKNSFHFA